MEATADQHNRAAAPIVNRTTALPLPGLTPGRHRDCIECAPAASSISRATDSVAVAVEMRCVAGLPASDGGGSRGADRGAVLVGHGRRLLARPGWRRRPGRGAAGRGALPIGHVHPSTGARTGTRRDAAGRRGNGCGCGGRSRRRGGGGLRTRRRRHRAHRCWSCCQRGRLVVAQRPEEPKPEERGHAPQHHLALAVLALTRGARSWVTYWSTV